MAGRRKYKKRAGTLVVAVQLELDTSGFAYRKWGGEQTCKPGDWIVNNGGDVYTVDRDTFARTYRTESPGLYRNVGSYGFMVSTAVVLLHPEPSRRSFSQVA